MTSHYSVHAFVLVSAAAVLIYAAISDVRRYLIPNNCSLILFALFPFHVWLSANAIDVTASVLASLSVFTVCIAFYALKRFGGGDVKLMSAVALWAGAPFLADFIVVTALAGGALSLIYITHFYIVPALRFDHAGPSGATDNALLTKLPYGVAIGAGGLCVLFQLAN